MAGKVSGASKRQQRTIRVFYSSPFRGLEREREMLSGVYWPRVGQACAQRGFTFVPIDFRWGITEESSSAANTVSICLNEVSRADLFVGFFGARYGWHGSSDSSLQLAIDKAIPQYPWLEQYRDRSVTEMEFLEARLRHPLNAASESNSEEPEGDPGLSSTFAAPEIRQRPAAFLFRDADYDAEMFRKLEQAGDPKEAQIYTAEIDGPNASLLLKNLKDQVERHKEQVNKTSEKNEEERKERQPDYCTVQHYKTPQEGARLMFEETMNMLNMFFLDIEQEQTQSKFDTWVEGQAAFMATQHTLGSEFLGRVEEQQFLGELLDNEDNWRLILKGEEGCGKSALVINHLHQKEELNHKSPRSNSGNSIDIYYSMSAYPGANSSLACLQFLAASLEHCKHSGDNQKESDSSKLQSENALRISKIGDLLERITSACLYLKESQQKSVHFFLDGIDRIDSQKTTDIPLGFLPKRLPLKQIVSTKSNDAFHLPAIEEGELIKILTLEKFKTHEAMEAVDSALKVRGKSLNEFCLQAIIQCEQICNFLFLKVLLDQLFSHAQFSSLETEVKDLCNCASVSEIFVLFLDKVEIVMGYEGVGVGGSTKDGNRV